MRRLVAVLAAALSISVPPALAAGPSAPPGFGRPAPKPKPEPQPGDIVEGEATFTLGGKEVRLAVAKGSITKSGDVFLVWANWRDGEKTENNFLAKEGQEFQIHTGAQRPGPLATGMQVTMSYARVEGTVSRLQRSSTCSLRLSELGEKSFAGEGSCTAGLLDAKGGPGLPITGLRFSGRAK